MSDEAQVSEALAYFDYAEGDRQLLAEIRPVLEKHADALVVSFYRHLLSFPATRQHLRDPAVKERLLVQQRDYLLSLAGPEIDEAYMESRRRIGEIHERIGLEPRWYLGAYALYLSLITPLVCEHLHDDPPRGEKTLSALQKLLLFDSQVAMETYISRRERELEYLNEELSRTGRRLAREYEEKTAELRMATERVRAAERLASIGTLVAGLAHEIGTPMGVIQGHAKLLESAVPEEKAKWRLKTIQEQIARISKIIQSLLNMARPTRSTRTPVALGPLLENTLAFLTEKLGRRGIQVVRDLPQVPSVHGDPERLQQLFLNLFLNAADAMPEGGRLTIALTETPEGEVEARVRDTGVGIGPDEIPHVFDPFFTSKAAGEGNGLGLAVAQGIVSEHGGAIEVESEPGAGTCFRVVLPVARRSKSGD